ncbi:2-keto-4-pentenoate hydratase/2-oxohepta-3-ene-1,7-dioic acid hydratase (catechol pathway) [Virgibacillus subterraneus]|uniref:2-keto-4-pentenoate hydratase/2-oxohepta-3-ene-1,7-dioic acid hydratase (Catechol pathway) n=1 Tax=Virgibacillus subterraneus TaxID=621109 RepID=A0A1H9G5K7_9BACI|nr:fumarylacetoacetate hydrolase family protein [Virgibacillus subterraneus]SEQ45389.1 2-keto-4-pentenoate hydratase/2-oxohepta-3-ene-1,7-dioic acid hydratase (catechol pathway) [Virgibacillus subterraneus]
MYLLSFLQNGVQKVGVKKEEGIISLPYTLTELLNCDIRQVERYLKEYDLPLVDESYIEYLACVPQEAKIICVGLNYQRHAEESGMQVPDYPILFNKFNNTLRGHLQEVTLPNVAKEYDYEAELGVVIGQQAKYISRETARQYIFGYCNINDLSARDLQNRTNQWLTGKSLDGFCPVGPYLVTADEINNPNNLRISCYLNGEVRQDSNTSDLIFDVDELVSYISQFMTLEPGDIILTGTPEGVILGYPEEKRQWLQPGDEVTIEIEKIGRLTNKFIKEK